MHVRPLSTLTHDEISALARTAADNGEDVDEANPFAHGTWQHRAFTRAARERQRELEPQAA